MNDRGLEVGQMNAFGPDEIFVHVEINSLMLFN
jgi:hypothetical protein